MTGDRLSALDAAFLQVEDAENRMQLAGMLVFEGVAPSYDEFRAAAAERVLDLPRFQQRLHTSRLGLGRPAWVDDPAFDLDYHLSHVALPAPGEHTQIAGHVDQLTSTPLDLCRPLWELGLVDGVRTESGAPGFAISLKVHHCMVDGLSIVDIMTALVDPLPAPAALPTKPGKPGKPALPASPAAPVAPTSAADRRRRLAEALPPVGKAPRSMLNEGRPGPTRRTGFATVPLADLLAVRRATDVTLNTVVLTVVAEALHRYLTRHDESADVLHAFVPVNRRASGDRGKLGNQIAMTYPGLAVGPMPLTERLERVRDAATAAIRGGQPATTATMMSALGYAPAPIAGMLNRFVQFRAAMFNLTVTNVPGPPMAVHFLGRRLDVILGSTPLTQRHALTVAVLSYAGALTFSVTTDPRRLPDGADIVDDIRDSLQALVAATAGTVAEK